jgi:hypothetical protein
MDNGEEKIEDAAEVKQLREQARKVQLKSASVAGLLTLLALLVPVRKKTS